MKKLFSTIICCVLLIAAFAQEIYVPTGAIGNSTNTNVRIGISAYPPESKLHVIGDIRIRGIDKVIFGDQNNGNGEWIQNTIGLPPGGNWGLSFFGSSAERVRMTNSGLFGIGNALLPTNRLHVKEAANVDPVRIQTLQRREDSSIVTVDNNGVLHQRAFNFNNGNVTLNCHTQFIVPVMGSGSMLNCSEIYDNGTSVGVASTGPFNYSGTSGMWSGVNSAPFSGIVKLEVNGVIRSLANIVTSDQNLKSNIKEITNPSGIITSLSGKIYNWNDLAQKTMMADKGGYHFGFIAQEVQKVLPEIVIKDEKGMLGINYTEVIPILVEGFKAQQAVIAKQEERIAQLEKRLK